MAQICDSIRVVLAFVVPVWREKLPKYSFCTWHYDLPYFRVGPPKTVANAKLSLFSLWVHENCSRFLSSHVPHSRGTLIGRQRDRGVVARSTRTQSRPGPGRSVCCQRPAFCVQTVLREMHCADCIVRIVVIPTVFIQRICSGNKRLFFPCRRVIFCPRVSFGW